MTAPAEVRYARTTDGIDIAYTAFGEGPDLLMAMGFVTHLDLMWDFPWHAGILGFASDHRVIVFDKRGTGLSDRSLGFGSLEDRARDIDAVLDAVRSESAILYGISEGGPMSVVFAASQPERVRGLIIYGSMARSIRAPDYPFGLSKENADAVLGRVEHVWGTGRGYEAFVQHPPDIEGARRALAVYERGACTPQMARQILQRNVEIDIRELLPAVTQPTLVIHCDADPLIPVEMGRYIADNIPNARFVEIEGDFHGSWRPADWVHIGSVVRAFLAELDGFSRSPRADRVLATVLFTDIVGSTERAADLGDAAWRALLDRHDAAVTEQVGRFDGRLVKMTGDGMLASFEGPSRAVLCARALHGIATTLGFPIRAGVHTGEVEVRGTDLGGIGVHIAARVAALADAGEVLATRTVRELTAGSGLEFAERGRHELKGVPDEWDLFALVD